MANKNLNTFIDDEEIKEVEAKQIIEKNEEKNIALKKLVDAEELATIKSIHKAQHIIDNNGEEITKTKIIKIEKDIVDIEDKYLDLDKIISQYESKPRMEKIKDGKLILAKNFDDIKEYIHKYIILSLNGDFYHRMSKKWIQLSSEQLNTLYLSKFPKEVREWFKSENSRKHKIVSLVELPSGINKINRNGKDYYFLNTFSGFMHQIKPYDEYTDEIKSKVDIFLKYIFDVLADGNKESYDYIIKWYANMCKGNKNDTILYLKGPEGIGKSSMTEIMANYVLGSKICTLSDTTPLVSKNNGNWVGKIYVIFEEFPTMSENMWNFCSSKLKTFITEKYSLYGEMYTKQVQLKNIHNFVMNTNVDAIKDSNGRRVFPADVSLKFKQNHQYFSNLRENCFNVTIGEAIYNYFQSIDVSKFQPQRDMPCTKNKIDSINNNLALELQFIKDKVLFKRQEGEISPDKLYEQYLNYLKTNNYNKTPKKKINFIKGLRENGIDFQTGRSRYNFYTFKYNDILELFKRNHWIHNLDLEQLEKKTKDNAQDDKPENYMFLDELKPDNYYFELESKYNELQKKYEQLELIYTIEKQHKTLKSINIKIKKEKQLDKLNQESYTNIIQDIESIKSKSVSVSVDSDDCQSDSIDDNHCSLSVNKDTEKVLTIREYATQNASTLLLCFN